MNRRRSATVQNLRNRPSVILVKILLKYEAFVTDMRWNHLFHKLFEAIQSAGKFTTTKDPNCALIVFLQWEHYSE